MSSCSDNKRSWAFNFCHVSCVLKMLLIISSFSRGRDWLTFVTNPLFCFVYPGHIPDVWFEIPCKGSFTKLCFFFSFNHVTLSNIQLYRDTLVNYRTLLSLYNKVFSVGSFRTYIHKYIKSEHMYRFIIKLHCRTVV